MRNIVYLLSIKGFIISIIFSSYTFKFKILQDNWKAPSWTDTLTNHYQQEPQTIAQGEELYQVYCWSCHGEGGYGDGPAGGSLGVKPANFHDQEVKQQSDGALYWKLSTGRGNMPPFKEAFSEEQLWQLIAYIRKISEEDD